MPRRMPSLRSKNASTSAMPPVLHRRSTAYDLTALRLHPNGVRATSTRKQVSKTIRDARGNLIARDAGGKTRVSGFEKRKRGATRVEEDGEVIDIGLGEHAGEGEGPKESGGEGEAKEVADYRAKKRRRFEREYDAFLEEHPRETNLLKTIHHFASNYYSKRSELFDGTARYRELRKERRKRKTERLKEEVGLEGGSSSESDPRVDRNADADEGSEGSEFSPSSGSDDDGDDYHTPRPIIEGGKRSPRRDMYRAFDGTALMAIGMILQEHVASLLMAGSSSIPQDNVHQTTEERGGEAASINGGDEEQDDDYEQL